MSARKKASRKKATTGKVVAKKPAAKKPSAKKPSAKKPAAKKPAAKKPAAKKPAAKKPAAKRPAAKKPATRRASKKKSSSTSKADRHEATLREFALGFPEAWEDHPWEENAFKVGKKVFFFLSRHEERGLTLSVKLPHSSHEALLLPFASPTGYGLGKHGWVSARFPEDRDPPIGILMDWVDESYRAIAPKKLLRELDER